MKRKIFSILFALMLVLSFNVVTGTPIAADSVTPSNFDGWYCVNYDGNFHVSTSPISEDKAVATSTGDIFQLQTLADAEYTDAGVALYIDGSLTIGDLSTLAVAGSGSSYAVNLWLDKGGDGQFFDFDEDGIMTDLSGDLYGHIAGSTNGALIIDDTSTVDLFYGGGTWTLAQLKAGECAGVTSNTKAALWIGVSGDNPLSTNINSVYLNGIPEVWVDDDWESSSFGDSVGGHTYGIDAYATIQDGIEAVQEYGTVNVAAGTYSATIDNSIALGGNLGYCFVHINKPITLTGESRDGVILDGTGLQDQVRSTGIWVSASNVMVKNLTIQNFTGTNYSYGLYVMEKFRHYVWSEVVALDHVTAENLKVVGCIAPLYFMKTEYATVKDCISENNLTDGIWISWGSHYATVEGNTVTNSGDHGVWVGISWMGDGPSNNATITNNIVNGAREGGISFVASDGAIISGNTITNVAGEDPSVGGWSVGALSLKDGCSNVEAFDNTIYNNDGSWGGYNGTGHGIGIDGTPSNINLHDNNIYGNTGYGLYNYSTVVVMATNSWWGSASGPKHAGNTFNVGSQGDRVSDNVDYCPWLDAPFDAVPAGEPFAPVWLDGTTPFSSIQAAIDAAAGTTITCMAGTYVENVNINKSLTLKAVSGAIIDGSANAAAGWDGSCIRIAANEVTIDGFEIKNGANGIAGVTSNSIIKNNKIHDNLNYVGSNGAGILLWGKNDGNAILDNEIYNNDRQGIFIGHYVWGDPSDIQVSTNNTISGNTIYDNGLYKRSNGPDASMYGVQLWNADNNTIEGNEIYGHNDWFPDPDNRPDFDWAQGIYLCGSYGNIVSENYLHNNNTGIGVAFIYREAGEPNQIHFNDIVDNEEYGVWNRGHVTDEGFDIVDAALNWWGDISGPQHDAPFDTFPANPGGLGDRVSDNVNYIPWLTREFQTVLDDNIAYFGIPMVYLNTGWNTFSTPIALDSGYDTWGEYIELGDGLAIYPGATTYYFDGENQVYGQVFGGYRLNPCDAIYVRMLEPDIAAILLSPEFSPVASKELYAGWNLVSLAWLPEGPDGEPCLAIDRALATVYTVTGDLTGWSLVVNPPVNWWGGHAWPSFLRAQWSGKFEDSPPMCITQGYWVFMINDGTLAGFTSTPIPLGMPH